MFRIVTLVVCASTAMAAEAIIQDRTHQSEVFGESRAYRVFLPPAYPASAKRYPVIYWFHGFGQRYNYCGDDPARDYDRGGYGGDTIAAFVATHDVIVVKWDGYNPRSPGEKYPRPYNVSPVETDRQFPLYFPELVQHIDSTYRTIADREHRATAGLSMGGFMSYWVAGKYPDLVSSASNFMGSSEFYVGPRGFDVEYRHEEMRNNYDGVRTRLVTGRRDFIQFYHRRMNALWNFTRAQYESEEFDADHGTPGMAKTLAFHVRAFASPLPRPAVWSHNDVYPNFSVWGWEVTSNRRQPGITALENVSSTGFRSMVREWLPEGAVMPNVKLSITTGRLYPPVKEQVVTSVRLRDRKVRRQAVMADAQGRLIFELDGEAYEVGIASGPVFALAGYRFENANWATAGRPVRVHVRIWNKGAGASNPRTLRWEAANPGVIIETPRRSLSGIASGFYLEVPVALTVRDETREIVRLVAVIGNDRLPLEIPLYPPAAATAFTVADGGQYSVYQQGVERREMRLGEGNGDGRADPGESIAILLPDGTGFRAAELFTNDSCVNNSTRVSDVWSSYDHVGASVKYSVPAIRLECRPGRVMRFVARVQIPDKPNHRLRYAVIEVPLGSATRK